MDLTRMGDVSAESLSLMKGSLAKNITISTGLTAYDLQAPAKNLYPILTPLRNKLARVGRVNPGDAARWRVINSILGSGFDAMGWVPEGGRSASMSYSAVAKSAPYTTLGEEDSITFEAEAAAEGFEDVNATATLRLLQKTMRKEEMALLGGNSSIALGTPVTPTLGAAGSAATLPAATYSVIVMGLTFEGWKNSSLSGGVASVKTITGNDGNTYTLNGGSSAKSANATQAITLGQTLSASTTPIAGAVAYAWFVGTAGSETLQAITTLPSVTFSAPLAGSRQAASTIAAATDFSQNAMAFDGLLSWALNPANSAYTYTMAAGAAGVGTPLTASGAGGVVEIDSMLQGIWDEYRLGPTTIYISSQEAKNIRNKILSNASGPLLRFNTDGKNGFQFAGGGDIPIYYNQFMGEEIPFMVHPDMPPGTILAVCERLPAWYQSNEVPNVAEVLTQRDYYRIDYPLRTRRREYGVYTQEVLAVYAPFGLATITNIGNG